MTTEQKNELIAKLEEASAASIGGQYHVANMFIQDARAMIYGTPAPAEAAEAVALAEVRQRLNAWVNGVRSEATAELALESYESDTPALLALIEEPWISVKTQLPEFGEEVLLLYGCALGKGRQTVGSFSHLGIDDAQACPQNAWLNSYQPTHWKPLKLAAARLAATPAAGDAWVAHKDALIAIREWHEDCEYSVLKRGDKDYIQAANYAPEYLRAVNLLLNIISPTDGKCVACNAVRYVLPGQMWGSCSNNECAAYKEDVASASYLDEAPPCAA